MFWEPNIPLVHCLFFFLFIIIQSFVSRHWARYAFEGPLQIMPNEFFWQSFFSRQVLPCQWYSLPLSIFSVPFCRTVVSQVITGYLPSLILQLFLKIVPPIMEFLSSIQGYISHSAIEKSACNKVLWFTIWNIFFATVFSGSVLYQVSIFLEPKNIPSKLAVAVPAQVKLFLHTEWYLTFVSLCS